MEIKKINNDVTIVCDGKKTRNGFRHEATVFKNNYEVGFAKVNYLNRTWESYPFQTVMLKAVDKSELTPTEKEDIKKILRK
jgi:predicted transcriptional regulator